MADEPLFDSLFVWSPGPEWVLPDMCPGGIVLHAYAVPTARLLLVRHLQSIAEAESTAEADADACVLLPGETAVCLVSYDGDTGERSTFGHPPGRIEVADG